MQRFTLKVKSHWSAKGIILLYSTYFSCFTRVKQSKVNSFCRWHKFKHIVCRFSFHYFERCWQASGLGSELDQVTGWRPAATKGKANDDGERVGIRGLFGTTRKLKFLVAISIAVILDAIVLIF